VEAFTNGTLIRNEAAAEKLAASVHQVQISLDGATQEVNDAIRGKGTYRKILRAIKLVTDAGLRVRLAITLMPSNAQDIANHLLEVVRSFGPGKIQVQIGLANVQGRADGSMRFADSVAAERVLRNLLAQLYAEGMRRPRDIKPNFRNTSCGYGRSINVASDGTVYGCALEVFPLGNVKDRPLRDIAEQICRLGSESEVDHIHGCRDCELRYFCNGGCRLNNFFRHKDLFITCCTQAKKDEVLRKLVLRETGEHLHVSDTARVGSFWSDSLADPSAQGYL
jgi:radical SAM protein with 4Fe4S-binding SPASM domain